MSNTQKYYIWNGILFAIVFVVLSFAPNMGGFIVSVVIVALFYRQRNPQVEYRGADYDEHGRPYPKGF